MNLIALTGVIIAMFGFFEIVLYALVQINKQK